MSASSSQNFFTPIAEDMQQVDCVIRHRLASSVPLIDQIAEYIIQAGGKRLRPALLLFVAQALGAQTEERYELAAVIEFIHTATLLHDDVVDDSKLRRGQETANARFGNPASVLVGDFLYSRAFQMMVNVKRLEVMEILSNATNVIAEGEVLQLLNLCDPDVDETRYMQVVRFKTAKLFEAAAQLGAILSCASPELEAAAAEFGRRLGTAFQIMDDWLDYAGDPQATGKKVGGDLLEGKPTLPLINLMKDGTPEQSSMARAVIEQGGTDQFEEIFTALTSSGALDKTLQAAQQEADAAAQALSLFPNSIYKQSLLELCASSTARQS